MSTRKRVRKNIMLLTTIHDDVQVTKDERCKPDSLVLYDRTKGAVDVVDLVSTHNTARIKHKRSLMNALVFILQEPVSQIKMSSFDFTYTVGKMLVLPHIERRYVNPNGLQSQLVNKMQRILQTRDILKRLWIMQRRVDSMSLKEM